MRKNTTVKIRYWLKTSLAHATYRTSKIYLMALYSDWIRISFWRYELNSKFNLIRMINKFHCRRIKTLTIIKYQGPIIIKNILALINQFPSLAQRNCARESQDSLSIQSVLLLSFLYYSKSDTYNLMYA